MHRSFAQALHVAAFISVGFDAAAGGEGRSTSAGEPPLRRALMRHVVALSDPALRGRAAGSEGERQAARYVSRELESAGLHAESQVFDSHVGTSRNVYALLEGRRRDEVVVVGAHIDHLGMRGGILYPGAEDDASGVAVVLELARMLVRHQSELNRSVLLVFFGAEEVGMLGSEAFVSSPPVPLERMAVMVNIDMIGRPLVDQPLFGPMRFYFQIDVRSMGLTGARRRPRLRALLDAACEKEDVDVIAAEDLPEPLDSEVERQARGRGDSVVFERAGVPAVFFGSGESSDYHQPTDTADRIDAEIMEQRAKALYQVMVALSRAPRADFDAESVHAYVAPNRRPPTGWYLPVGFSTGIAVHSDAADGAYVGLEASFVHFSSKTQLWIGAYGDALYDFSNDTTRVSVGPELGIGPVGIDGGFLSELSESRQRRGFAVRPMVTLSGLALTGRVAHFIDTDSPETFGEIGVLFKAPFGIALE